ncbi:hypothetical protein [Oribacterium sp. FC2011]|uniref:hypothetical protein n=1 Tax=Oribacterium sp. FC2011 TaxID=1408311 RepID=UPI0004E0C4B2|nr:hypothetical protein [Oribacterium sp. FC2011]
MKSKSILALGMTACVIATGCSTASVPEATETELTRPEMALEETESVENTNDDHEKESDSTMTDASQYVSSIENSNIDPALYLDYSAGIEAGVYKWILSEDENYYILAALDEKGEPIEAIQKAINVGANNQESIDLAGGDKKGDGAGQRQGGGGQNQGGMPGGMMEMMNRGTVYQGVYINSNITNTEYQTMAIYVPKDYMKTDSDGNVTGINHEAKIGNYTADTAPVVYLNEMGGWRSSSPKAADTSFLDEGMIYVSAGGRSRDAVDENGNITGKSPTQMVDLKSGLIELRANTDVIPGDMTKIISTGTSGGGQMSSILGASGNMAVYYPYMYEAGVLGVTKNADGNYSSVFDDSVYAAQLYCPIADLENADIAYAWWWVNLADKGGIYNGSITDFEKRLQELEAEAFVEYINGLNLRDSKGNALTLTGLREGSYYDAILQNISDALNAAVTNGDINPDEAYKNYSDWLTKNDDETWQVTDLDGFMIGTGLVNKRNKAIPGFDTMDKSAEGDAFGTDTDQVVHFSKSVAQILSDNYEELSSLKGFDKEAVDDYIDEVLNSEKSALIEEQTNLLNATEILLANNGHNAANFAHYWRDRSGTADQHTSFSVGYNILLAAQLRGATVDYHLVWDMQHGNNEGTSTGTMIDWIKEICS